MPTIAYIMQNILPAFDRGVTWPYPVTYNNEFYSAAMHILKRTGPEKIHYKVLAQQKIDFQKDTLK